MRLNESVGFSFNKHLVVDSIKSINAMLSKQMFRCGLLGKAKTMWPRSTAIRSVALGCRTRPNMGLGLDVLGMVSGLKMWACPADQSAWTRTPLESGSRPLAHNLAPYERGCGSPTNRPPRPTAQADGVLGCVRSGRRRGTASLLSAPVMARHNMSTSASGEGVHDHIESIGELGDASLGLEVVAQLAEELPSTLWSRFYSGSPDFWVNVAYAQEVVSHPSCMLISHMSLTALSLASSFFRMLTT